MLYLKACPRCRGDVHFAVDIDGPYLQCLQCSFSGSSVNRQVIAAWPPEKPAAATAARERAADNAFLDRINVLADF